MEDLRVQQNLEKNIKKVFEKIQEEGIKGASINKNCYPIEEILNVELKNEDGMFVRALDTGKRIKDYNDYMKLIRTLDTLINMYSHISIDDYNISDKIRRTIEKEIGYIQTTGLESLDKGFISQYSCLIKCYEMLLRMSRMIKSIRPINNKLPQYINNITVNTNGENSEGIMGKLTKAMKESIGKMGI